MKQFYFFTVFISLSSLMIYAQNFWEFNGLGGNLILDLCSDNSSVMYAATIDSGLFRSADGGNYWEKCQTGLTSNSVWSVTGTNNPVGHIFSGTNDAGLFKSTDSGINWSFTGLLEWVAEIANNSNGNIFAATISDGIYRSTDIGISWQKVSDYNVGTDVYSIIVTLNNDIFAGTDAHIFHSTDNGNTWSESDSGVFVTGVIWSIVLNSSGDILVGDGGFFTGPGSVYRSSDNGISWIQTSITNRSSNDILTISPQTIFVATDSGVYVSYDNGISGNQINDGLTNLTVFSLSLNEEGYLFAGTADGIFRSFDPVTYSNEPNNNFPLKFSLLQNYPNPFNPTTKIKYQIPEISFIILKIYDILGNEVKTLANEEKPAGTYEVEWNAGDFPSGIYFYQLKSNDFVETKKMILIK